MIAKLISFISLSMYTLLLREFGSTEYITDHYSFMNRYLFNNLTNQIAEI